MTSLVTSRETAARAAPAGVTPRRPLQPALGLGCALLRAPGARKGCAHLRDRGAEEGEEPTIALEATTLPARAPRSPKDTTAPAEGQPRWPRTTRRREAARAPSMAAAGRTAAGPRLYLAPASGPAPGPAPGPGPGPERTPRLLSLKGSGTGLRSPKKKLNRNVTHSLNCVVPDILFHMTVPSTKLLKE